MTNFNSYVILPELRLIVTNFQGKTQLDDVIQLNLKFLADQAYDSSYDVIMDFRDSLAIGFRMDLMDYVEFFKKSVSLKQKIRLGIMYQTSNQEFLLNIYKPIAKLLKMELEIFRTLDGCLTWMKYTDEEQVLIKEALSSIKSKSPDDNMLAK